MNKILTALIASLALSTSAQAVDVTYFTGTYGEPMGSAVTVLGSSYYYGQNSYAPVATASSAFVSNAPKAAPIFPYADPSPLHDYGYSSFTSDAGEGEE